VAQSRSGWALDLRLEMPCSIPDAVLSSSTCSHTLPLSPYLPSSNLVLQCKLGSKQVHRATHWPCVHGLAASADSRLTAIESGDQPRPMGQVVQEGLLYFIVMLVGLLSVSKRANNLICDIRKSKLSM